MNINSYMTSNAQIAIPNLDITTSGQAEWYYVNVPSSTTGTMTVTVQSSNLSSLAPSLQVYSSSLSLIGQTSAPDTFGATDQRLDERGVRSRVLLQGRWRRWAGADRRLRFAAQLRQSDSIADSAAQHGRFPAARSRRRHGVRRCALAR